MKNGKFNVWALYPVMFSTFLMVFFTCQEHPQEKSTTMNPKVDSELALLMRDMFEDSDSLKQRILHDKALAGLERYEKIHTAIATDPSINGPVFEAFADAYINSIKALESEDSNSVANFNNMVDQCMNCHTEFCPGPKKRIRQLYIAH